MKKKHVFLATIVLLLSTAFPMTALAVDPLDDGTPIVLVSLIS